VVVLYSEDTLVQFCPWNSLLTLHDLLQFILTPCYGVIFEQLIPTWATNPLFCTKWWIISLPQEPALRHFDLVHCDSEVHHSSTLQSMSSFPSHVFSWSCVNKTFLCLIFSLVWCVCSSHITFLDLIVVTAYEANYGTARFVISSRLFQFTQSLNRKGLIQAVYIRGSASYASHVLLILCPSPPVGTIYGSRAHCCALKSLMGSGQGACPQMRNSSLFPKHSLPP
jgi:hypothetical protein